MTRRLFLLRRIRAPFGWTGRAVARTIPRGSILVICIAGSPSCIGNAAHRGPRSRLQSADQRFRAWRAQCALVRLRGLLALMGRTTRSKCIDKLLKGMVSKSAFSAISIPIPPLVTPTVASPPSSNPSSNRRPPARPSSRTGHPLRLPAIPRLPGRPLSRYGSL